MGRTIALGDIHGCSTALSRLLEQVDLQPDDQLIALGDYIDRGPSSREVVDIMLELRQRCRVVALLGNHEILLLEAIRNGVCDALWLACGGRETIESYGGSLKGVPASHLAFFDSCARWHEGVDHFYLHANYDPQVDPDELSEELLFWRHLQEPFPAPHYSGRIAVVGHTPQLSGLPLVRTHLLGLDTFCFGGGWLTACEVNSGQIWQANQLGQQRRLAADDLRT